MRSWLRTSLALLVCLTHLPSWANAGEIDGDSGSAPIVVPHIADAGPNAQCVALSADGQLVAAAYGGPTNHRFPLQPRGGGIAIYQRATGKRLHFVAEYGDIIQLQFSADGRALVYTRLYTPGDSVDDNVTVVLDTKTGAARQRWRVGEVAASVSASAAKDGDQAGLVAIRGGGSVELYDLKELAKVQQLDQLSARVIALSPKAERLAAITLNREGPSLRIIESATSRDLCSASDDDLRTALVLEWSADGKLLATGHAQGLAKLWRAEDLELLHTFAVETAAHVRPVFATASDALWLFSQPVQGVRWSYDRQAASGFKFESQRLETDAEAWSFELADFKERQRLRFEGATYRTWYARFGNSKNVPEYNTRRFTLSPDGRSLLVGCNGAAIYQLPAGKLERQFNLLEPPPTAEQD